MSTPDYTGWITLATSDDDTPIWSGPPENAQEWQDSDQGQSFTRALAHRKITLVSRTAGF